MAQQGGSGKSGQATVGNSKKLSVSEAGFVSGGGVSNLRCGDCAFYVNETCEIVDVNPGVEDYCDEFEPGTTGNMAASAAIAARSVRAAELYITRVSKDPETGVRRWRATSSGVKRDLYGERMTVELYNDFIRRIEKSEPVPSPFSSKAWNGGLPYLGVAHYLDLDGFGIVGPTKKIWVDGEILKAKGEFFDTPLADKVFEAIRKDEQEGRPDNERVRISIAFLDWGHRHGDGGPIFARESLTHRCEHCDKGAGDKTYTKGQLIHLATTRRPAYPETEIVALEARSMSKIRDDAASIVGDEMADELEKRASALTERSASGDVAPGAVVIRKEEEPADGSGKPFGGATTLDEAEAFLAKSSGPVLLDDWGVLAGVLENIAERSEEKGAAIRDALHQFQDTLDLQTARALVRVERSLGGKHMTEATEGVVQRQEEEPMDDEEKKKRQEEEKAEAEEEEEKVVAESVAVKAEHPLDSLFAEFRSNYDEVMASPGTAQEKLAALQQPFNALGTSLQQTVRSVLPESTEEVVARALAEQRKEFQNQLAAMEARLKAAPAGGETPPLSPSVPVRRAVRRGPVPTNSPVIAASDPAPVQKSETPKLQSIIRRTVYGG